MRLVFIGMCPRFCCRGACDHSAANITGRSGVSNLASRNGVPIAQLRTSTKEQGPMQVEWVDAALRLSASVAVGMSIGLNRDLQNTPIGIRTLGLVGLGAAV